MKSRRILISSILLLGLASVQACKENRLEGKMRELKDTIKISGIYESNFQHRVSLLKEKLRHEEKDSLKADIEYRLFQEYQSYNVDSAKIYASKLMELDSEIFPKDVMQAWHYSINGEKAQFISIFDSFNPSSIPQKYLSDCYSILASSYLLILPFDNRLREFMSSAIQDPETHTDLKEMFIGTIYRSDGKYEEAGSHFLAAYEADGSPHMNMKARNAFLLAHIYRELDRFDEYEYWLAQSSIHDLQAPVKAYAALQDLSIVELYRHHYKEAYDLIDVFLKDAVESRNMVWINKAIQYEQMIIHAMENVREKSIIALSLSSLMLLLMLVTVLSFLRKNTRLNKALAISDREKEEYIHKYMKLSLNYLGSVEKYRHKLRMMLKERGKDAVIAQLRGPSESEAEYTDFYKEFDDTFLKIYPDFVSRVNELLMPEARFEDEHSLNLPLRVMAAIRLGISESKDIATFLNCATSSVYTYRSKMKANALDKKEEFESRIRKIS